MWHLGYASHMATNTRTIDATPEQVWDVLADGWLYPLWVVGASRIREVEDAWPQEGTRLHHSVGVWPLLIDDYTEVTHVVPGEQLCLRARAWPVGEGAVTISLQPVAGGTKVEIVEDAVSGPGVLVPPPARGLTVKWRNVETLRRLAYLAERRS